MYVEFQSTRPSRGATISATHTIRSQPFQSTRPLRDATFSPIIYISLDTIFQSTRPLRDATVLGFAISGSIVFQSTRPLRDATHRLVLRRAYTRNFNPRAPCGARPKLAYSGIYSEAISIHAPLAGRDRYGVVTNEK